MNKNIIKCFAVLLILTLCFVMVGCGDKTKVELPSHYFNLQVKYIAYTYNDCIYNKDTHRFLAKYDYELHIFIDKDGLYYGEIIKENILVYNSKSEYIGKAFEIGDYEEIGNIPPIPPMRAMIPTQPLYIQNVDLYN